MDRIKRQLQDGKNVVITSGLLKALQGKGIEDIVELEYTGRTVAAREFFGRGVSARSETDILIPEIRYATNDSWEVVSALTSPSRTTGTPILHSAKYSKGVLYVLTIPQAQGDLYSLPAGRAHGHPQRGVPRHVRPPGGAEPGEPVRLRQRHVHRGVVPREHRARRAS